MKSKFIIFVVLATLAQSSNVLAADYGLTIEQLSNFTQITSNQEAGIQAAFDAVDSLFTVAAKHAAELIYGLEATTDDDSSEIAEALARGKDAINYFLDAILISVGTSCEAIENTRTDSYTDLEDVYSVAENAMSLALAGNYPANRAEIEKYQTQINESVKNISARIYDSLIECRGTTDEGELCVIKTAREGSSEGLVRLIHAIFNTIKILADAITTGSANVTLINIIEDSRNLAHVALESNFEYKFSGIKAIFLARVLDLDQIVSSLSAIQYAYIASENKYQHAFNYIGEIIGASLQNIDLGLSDAGENDYSATNFSHDKALAAFQHAADTVLIAIVASNPEAATLVENRRPDVRNVIENIVGNYVAAAVAARSADTDGIDTNRSRAYTNVATFTNYIFEVLRNGKTWGNATETEMTNLKQKTQDTAKLGVDNLFDILYIVAEAAAANTVTEDNYAAIANLSSQVLATINDYSSLIARVSTIALKANNAS